MISVETANVASTYYINMLIGFIQLLVSTTEFLQFGKPKLIEHRLNAHDERARNQAEKITQLEKELKILKDKENDRYIEVSKLNAKLDTDSKNTKEVVNRLVESVDKLVDKIDVMTKTITIIMRRSNVGLAKLKMM